MKLTPTAPLPFILTVALLLSAGCSSTNRTLDSTKYNKMSCTELNVVLGETATDISRTAITRRKVANTSVPTWLLRGSTVKTSIANRETARIERRQQQQQAIVAARNSQCPSSQ